MNATVGHEQLDGILFSKTERSRGCHLLQGLDEVESEDGPEQRAENCLPGKRLPTTQNRGSSSTTPDVASFFDGLEGDEVSAIGWHALEVARALAGPDTLLVQDKLGRIYFCEPGAQWVRWVDPRLQV